MNALVRFAVARSRDLLPLSIAGLVATGVDYGALYFFIGILSAAAVVAASAAFVLSTGTNFVLQKFWTYRDPCLRALPRQLLLFAGASVLGLVVNDLVFYAFNDLARVGYVLAQVPTTAAVSAIGFLASRYIFARQKTAEARPAVAHP